MFLIDNAGTTPGQVLDSTKDIALVLMAPELNAARAITQPLKSFLQENGVWERLATIHLLSHIPIDQEKKECPLSVMKQGWERVKLELNAFAPNVKRVFFLGTTKALRVLVPKLGGEMGTVHGTLFSVNVALVHSEERNLVVVPTFLLKDYSLSHMQAWMVRDCQRLLKLTRPQTPLEYGCLLPKDVNLWKNKIVVDLETTGLELDEGAYVTHLGVQWSDTERAIITDDEFIGYSLDKIAEHADEVWFHGGQFDLQFLGEERRLKLYGKVRDTLVRSRARGELVNSLKHLGNTYTSRPGNYAWHKPGVQHDFGNPDYICEDLDVTWRLSKLWANQNTPIVQLAERVIVMNASQKYHGSKMDTELLDVLATKNAETVQSLREELTAEYGCDPNQTEALIESLRNKGYFISKKTRKGNDSLTADVLLENGLLDILEYRQAQKMDSSFVGKMRSLLRPGGFMPHSQSILNARSGRSSMERLNWQNLPRSGPSKGLLVSRWPGGKILQVDLAQAEVRSACWLSEDLVMAEWLNSGVDAHSYNAAQAFQIAIEEVSKEQRQDSKALLFRVLFGGSATNDVQKRVEKYLRATFKRLFSYLEATGKQSMADNRISDPYGKCNNLQDIFDYRGKWGVKRAGINSPIQGIASHISQIISLRSWEQLRERRMESLILFGVHDSSVYDVHPDEIGEVIEVVEDSFAHILNTPMNMFKYATLVPIIGEVLIADNWGDTKKQKPFMVSSLKRTGEY